MHRRCGCVQRCRRGQSLVSSSPRQLPPRTGCLPPMCAPVLPWSHVVRAADRQEPEGKADGGANRRHPPCPTWRHAPPAALAQEREPTSAGWSCTHAGCPTGTPSPPSPTSEDRGPLRRAPADPPVHCAPVGATSRLAFHQWKRPPVGLGRLLQPLATAGRRARKGRRPKTPWVMGTDGRASCRHGYDAPAPRSTG